MVCLHSVVSWLLAAFVLELIDAQPSDDTLYTSESMTLSEKEA